MNKARWRDKVKLDQPIWEPPELPPSLPAVRPADNVTPKGWGERAREAVSVMTGAAGRQIHGRISLGPQWRNEHQATDVGSNLNAGGGMGLSSGEGYGRRPWLMPQDLYRIRPGFGYVWATGLSGAIPSYFPPYWDVATLNARARPNPYYKG